MTTDQQLTQKMQVAKAALAWVKPDAVVGVGTGSTVNCFIDALAASGIRIEAAVSSSEGTSLRLKAMGITVADLNQSGTLDVYI
ncbi:MAG: ribose-5-phosphate isomerase RpiA, partial [Lysobacterales bacterium]